MGSRHKPDSTVFQKRVHQALRAWHNTAGEEAELLDSLLQVQEQRRQTGGEGSPALQRLATNQVLFAAIDVLAEQDENAAQVLRLRFPEDHTLQMVANRLNFGVHSVSRVQRAAIKKLSDLLLARDAALREEKAQQQEVHFPPPTYSRLVGLETARAEVKAKLLGSGSPWIVALVGIGGIGKTALADALVRDIVRELVFEQVIWLRIDPQTMSGRSYSPQITFDSMTADLAQRLWPDIEGPEPGVRMTQVRQALKSRRLLVVIDNLESDVDTAFLTAQLHDLANPSRFLLTSRSRPAADATVFTYSLTELSLADATALITHYAQESGLLALAQIAAAEMQEIYGVTGGNPLALKLVISLLDMMPLPQIVSGLESRRQGPIEEMYRHIYWKAWQSLTGPGKSLLLAMPLVAKTGARPEQLQQVTSLSEADFWLAVQELRKRSLLEVRGTIHDRRFGIHRLTETFLQTEVIYGSGDNG